MQQTVLAAAVDAKCHRKRDGAVLHTIRRCRRSVGYNGENQGLILIDELL